MKIEKKTKNYQKAKSKNQVLSTKLTNQILHQKKYQILLTAYKIYLIVNKIKYNKNKIFGQIEILKIFISLQL